jgi:integrase
MGDHATTDPSGTTLRAAVDRFLSSPRCANPNTRRRYAAALDKLTERLGADRPLAAITPAEVAGALEKTLWRMLYETAARAGESLALNIEDLDLDAHRGAGRKCAPGVPAR